MTVTEEARKFHGDQNYNAHDLMTKLNKKDWKEQKQTIDEYLERFDTETSNAEKRKAVYMKIVNNYYDLGK